MRRLLFLVLVILALGCTSLSSPAPVSHGLTTAETQKNEVTVYITDTGERYHVSSCRYLRHSKHPVSLSQAKRQGYTPCKVCQPPR